MDAHAVFLRALEAHHLPSGTAGLVITEPAAAGTLGQTHGLKVFGIMLCSWNAECALQKVMLGWRSA